VAVAAGDPAGAAETFPPLLAARRWLLATLRRLLWPPRRSLENFLAVLAAGSLRCRAKGDHFYGCKTQFHLPDEHAAL
jgi:hypothetical protein